MDTWDSDTYGLDLRFSIRETVCPKASGRDPSTCDFKSGPFVVGAPAGAGNHPSPCRGRVAVLLVLRSEEWLAAFYTSCSMEWALGGKGQWWEALLLAQWGGQGAEKRICVWEQRVVKVCVLLGPNPRRNGLFFELRADVSLAFTSLGTT